MSLEHSPARQRGSAALFEDDQFYSAEEVQKKLGGRTHLITIWRWSRTGVLPKAKKIAPNTSRFLGSELNAHLLNPKY